MLQVEPAAAGPVVVARDLRSGEELWTLPDPAGGTVLTASSMSTHTLADGSLAVVTGGRITRLVPPGEE
ncbi:hypothetical protein [Cellulomonas marina]|uniref:PQQ-like domain-containing protein n=1 Tax=Cellulomonas marina TaxID=988821 RepID=A0A1I0ZJ40_9CELL|nr:hypothetical protein [Cellulomonas marina]GIG28644.1 hypothetical protein Cma02nite_12440 [Cellulomonas marina]SFB25799.1 hypothetical protein SAMN05421867_111134 [Cellulomonas marina]